MELKEEIGHCYEEIRNCKGRTAKLRMKEHCMFIKNYYGYKGDKRTLLLNCVEPELGLHIFKMAFKEVQKTIEV